MLLDDSDNDLEIIGTMEEKSSLHHRAPQRQSYIRRNHLQAHKGLFLDYFAESPLYPQKMFRRRFRMRLPLFCRILSAVEVHEPYYVQRRDNAGRLGLSSLQKITAALRMLAYGITGDLVDEYLKIGETIPNPTGREKEWCMEGMGIIVF
jgi:hypothetical protein